MNKVERILHEIIIPVRLFEESNDIDKSTRLKDEDDHVNNI